MLTHLLAGIGPLGTTEMLIIAVILAVIVFVVVKVI
jgi:hypothetical protein